MAESDSCPLSESVEIDSESLESLELELEQLELSLATPVSWLTSTLSAKAASSGSFTYIKNYCMLYRRNV